jgi:hypothetical protein
MLKLEQFSDEERITVRLIGRVRSEHLNEITNQMGSRGSKGADTAENRLPQMWYSFHPLKWQRKNILSCDVFPVPDHS